MGENKILKGCLGFLGLHFHSKFSKNSANHILNESE